MMKGNKMLSQSVADNILSMITIEKKFSIGDKLPNELDLAEELNVSRTTLREAIRIWSLWIYWKYKGGKAHTSKRMRLKSNRI